MMNSIGLKKAAIAALAAMTLLGGATSAFADGKGKGHDKHSHDGKAQSKSNNGKGNNGKGNNGKGNKDNKDRGGQINWTFKDEQELKWALEHIMRLASKGVFNGYEDGTFKPHQKVSRIEALVAAVRLMGLREQAESDEEMETKLNFKDADKIERNYPWAVGYVAVAVENDLFAETDDMVQPDKPADRLWAATLLVKALKLHEEAREAGNTELKFRDARSIPAGSVGYVAVAVERELVTGYEDNTFRPNQPVTRAELAALLDRTDGQMPDHDANAITGELKRSVTRNQITVVKADGSEVTLTLDGNAFIFRDGKKVTASALQAGDEVLVRTYQNRVVFIEVTDEADKDQDQDKQDSAFKETGKVSSFRLNNDGDLATITITQPVDGGTQARIYNVSPDVKLEGKGSLAAGREVTVKGKNGVVTHIKLQ